MQVSPAPGEWSANDVLAHLRACADVWGGYILRMLDEDRPTFDAVSSRTWITQTNYPELDFGPSLRAFASQRAELFDVLEPSPPDGWARTATVTAVGRVLEPTVLSYAERLVIHERSHITQVVRIVATSAGEHRPARTAS